jgi:tRNA pseudouridine38-40 synthase
VPRLKLTLEYDGTDFVGWQYQLNGRSVQAVVETALGQLLGHPVEVAAAGRTDSGVHAEGQVVAFSTDRALPSKAYVRGLISLLPPDVAVVDVKEVPDGFDPRRWSLGKRYRYRVSNRPGRSPLRRRTHWEVFAPLNVPAMAEAARLIEGRHDFSAFRAADCTARHPVREVTRLAVTGEQGADIVFTVDGTAFLKHMVRNLVGTLVLVGRGNRPVEWVREVLESRERPRAGPTAPGHGLTLVHVLYGTGPRQGE